MEKKERESTRESGTLMPRLFSADNGNNRSFTLPIRRKSGVLR